MSNNRAEPTISVGFFEHWSKHYMEQIEIYLGTEDPAAMQIKQKFAELKQTLESNQEIDFEAFRSDCNEIAVNNLPPHRVPTVSAFLHAFKRALILTAGLILLFGSLALGLQVGLGLTIALLNIKLVVLAAAIAAPVAGLCVAALTFFPRRKATEEIERFIEVMADKGLQEHYNHTHP